jgi:myxalamid-type polyketide synthase MxaE and MxaD
MGMDSLLSLELRNLLQTSLGCTLSATVLFEFSNIQYLAEYLITKIFESIDFVEGEL